MQVQPRKNAPYQLEKNLAKLEKQLDVWGGAVSLDAKDGGVQKSPSPLRRKGPPRSSQSCLPPSKPDVSPARTQLFSTETERLIDLVQKQGTQLRQIQERVASQCGGCNASSRKPSAPVSTTWPRPRITSRKNNFITAHSVRTTSPTPSRSTGLLTAPDGVKNIRHNVLSAAPSPTLETRRSIIAPVDARNLRQKPKLVPVCKTSRLDKPGFQFRLPATRVDNSVPGREPHTSALPPVDLESSSPLSCSSPSRLATPPRRLGIPEASVVCAGATPTAAEVGFTSTDSHEHGPMDASDNFTAHIQLNESFVSDTLRDVLSRERPEPTPKQSPRRATWRVFKGLSDQPSLTQKVLQDMAEEKAEMRGFHGLIESARQPRPVRTGIAAKALEINPPSCIEKAAIEASLEHCDRVRRAEHLHHYLREHPVDSTMETAFMDSIKDVKVHRPRFVAPIPCYSPPKFKRLGGTWKKPIEKKPDWVLETSLYKRRARECDSRMFYDTPKVFARKLDNDFTNALAKVAFPKAVVRTMLSKGRPKQREGSDTPRLEPKYSSMEDIDPNAVMVSVKNVFKEHYEIISRLYTYYSITGGGTGAGAFSMKLNAWSRFIKDCDIIDPKSERCKSQDIDTAFVATNFEEGDNDDLNDDNDDQALMRFEFIEILTRVAVMKYGHGVKTFDPAEALKMLIEINILPNMLPEVLVDANTFRRERLYCAGAADVFAKYSVGIIACFCFYKARDAAKLMGLDHWLMFCEKSGLTSPLTRASQREAKIIFAWSQPTVVDEIKNRKRTCGITVTDFMEAIARMADLISPPTPNELAEYFKDKDRSTQTPTWEFYQKVTLDEAEAMAHPSAELVAENTRPLAEKLDAVLELAFCTLFDAWGVSNIAQLAAKMKSLTKTLGGDWLKEGEHAFTI